MALQEILVELPKLGVEERHQVSDLLCDLKERDLLLGVEPTEEEKRFLDAELADLEDNPTDGSPWEEVKARLRNSQ